jgi:DNA-binding transcriptional LysR family regulator
VAWTLAATRTVLAASPDYIKQNGAPRAPKELINHRCLFYPRTQGASTWTFISKSDDATDPVTVPVTGQLSVNNSEALRDGAIDGLGIALLPDFSAQSALQSGSLVEVLTEWRSIGAFGDWLYLIRPYAAHTSRVSQAFVDHVRVAFASGFNI